MKRIRQFIFYIKSVKHFFDAQRHAKHKVPGLNKMFGLVRRWSIFFSGFTPDKLIWYDFTKYKKSDYISDFDHYYSFEKIDRANYYVANDKLVCERFLMPFCKIVPTVGFIYKGRFYAIGKQTEITSLDDLMTCLKKGQEFFMKPNGGGSGRGIGKISWVDGEIYWNKEVVANLESFISDLDDYIVQYRFQQSGYSHDVNPDTLNTLRITTMIDPKTKKPFIGYACHRFGRKGFVVDNIAQGNLLCPIDAESGVIKFASYIENGKLVKLEEHPDTKVKIAGVKVPHWERVVETCFSLAQQVPFMPLCGWDIIVSGDDIYMQELNYNPDIYLGQIDAPLLLKDQVKEFYNYYKK